MVKSMRHLNTTGTICQHKKLQLLHTNAGSSNTRMEHSKRVIAKATIAGRTFHKVIFIMIGSCTYK